MDKSTVSTIIESLKQKAVLIDGDSVDFTIKNVRSIPFSADNFHKIPENTQQDTKIAFIDGGNSEIFASPAFCLHFIRVYHTIYSDNKRVSCNADEFYAMISAKKQDDTLFYEVLLLPSRAKTLTEAFFSTKFSFNSTDPALRTGDSRIEISRIPSVIRRLAELSTALLLINNLDSDDSIMLDGDLEARVTDEKKLIAALKSVSLRNNIRVCGLSKTTSLLTREGASVASALNRMTDLPIWYYYPVAESDFHISFLKLHPKSGHVFRFDSFTHPVHIPAISLLVRNSIDPVFLGYPYGLIEADRFARVSNQDADGLKAMMFARAGSEAALFRQFSQASDAHIILDNIL